MPASLRDTTVAASRKDGLGQIVLKRISGLETSPTLKIVRRFVEQVGGEENLAEGLTAVEETLNPEERQFLAILQEGSNKKSPARLMAELGISPLRVIKAYAEGAKALGKLEAVIEAAKHQPQIVKDLARHALDGVEICTICVGSGKVKRRPGAQFDTEPCPSCEGRGRKYQISELKRFAVDKLMDMNSMLPEKERAPLVQVQQNVGVRVGGGGGTFVERMLKSSDEILYGRKKAAKPVEPIVEAEVVSSTDHSSEQS